MDNKGRISCSLGGGGEMIRRIHIIYFLNRLGRNEHPHLIRVHHLAHNGVHLRDVKGWLSELRGKDMPDSFAWSYKRKYKMGYVWQDILDEDLITPISDNEYVLKGSDIPVISSSFEPCSCGGKKASKETHEDNKDDSQEANIIPNDEDSFVPLDYSMTSTSSSRTTTAFVPLDYSMTSTSTSSSRTTTATDESLENSLEKKKEKEKNKNKNKKGEGGGATNVFRSLLNCRTIDTNDAATMEINNHMKKNNEDHDNRCTIEIDGVHSFGGGSKRIFGGTCWNLQTQHQHYIRRSFTGEKSKKVLDAFKPVSEPHCSQCGKGFKPEKLHSHMKSCRGLKSSSKNHGSVTVVAGSYDVANEANMNYPIPTK